MTPPSILSRLVRRSIALTCAWYLVDDWRARRRLAAGRIETRSGRRHADLELDASIDYVERVAADYLAYAGRARFVGRLAEIGPGDSLGVAVMALARGAREVHTVDRYRTVRDATREEAILAALAGRHGPLVASPRGVVEHGGVPAETFFARTDLDFDWIVSRAVLEHLYDPVAALDAMRARLAPGGVMVHRIDLRDHGMFAGHHPLTFLTVPDAIYRLMTRGAGRPNRVLLPAYRDWLARGSAAGSIRVTRLVGIDGEVGPAPWDALDHGSRRRALAEVAAVRPRFAASLRGFSDQDLAVSGIVLVAEP
ncbi:MAG: methyltransferase domain-containing protein [Alphaproteobacteria bacterium]